MQELPNGSFLLLIKASQFCGAFLTNYLITKKQKEKKQKRMVIEIVLVGLLVYEVSLAHELMMSIVRMGKTYDDVKILWGFIELHKSKEKGK